MLDTDMTEVRWSALMTAAHGGDRRAYEALLGELGQAIERYICRHFGRLSFCEDCVQECLLAIHKGRHTWDTRRPFRPWMYTIVRHRVIDLLRSAYAGKEAPETAMQHQPVQHDASADIEAGEVLAQLDSNQRDALTLTKIHGYSLAEAAQRSGISESAMKSRVARALRAAALLLRQHQDHH
jgi:RNA polymerase sigma-70 factor (ECF subfamily)